jgi:hypothetical protein
MNLRRVKVFLFIVLLPSWLVQQAGKEAVGKTNPFAAE